MLCRFVQLASVLIILLADVACSQRSRAITRRVVSASATPINGETLLGRTRKAIVKVTATSSGQQAGPAGTGFIVSNEGHILTCNHVVTHTDANGNPSYYQTLRITLSDGATANAIVVGSLTRDRVVRDYALLKIEGKTPDFLEISDTSEVKTGDDLIAWGFPFGLPGPVLIKASVATTLKEIVEGTEVQAIVFQGPNNKGMSGGPVILNRTGRVIGITSNRLRGLARS